MKKDDVELLREIQRNTQMGLQALEMISSKAYDDRFSLQLTRESMKYSELHDRARAQLLAGRQRPDPENKVNRMMLSAAVTANTMFNTTTSHLAQLMIRGSNMGLTSLWKAMNHTPEAGEKACDLAKELINFEENNIKELKKYL